MCFGLGWAVVVLLGHSVAFGFEFEALISWIFGGIKRVTEGKDLVRMINHSPENIYDEYGSWDIWRYWDKYRY
jgi:hypothetical protein